MQFWNSILILAIVAKIEQHMEVSCRTLPLQKPNHVKPTNLPNFISHEINLNSSLFQHEMVKTLKKYRMKATTDNEIIKMRNLIETNESFVQRVRLRMTRSRDAKWASLSFSFICILLLFGVCYSKMWREYRGTASNQPTPLFMIRESVPFIEVIRRKIRLLKQLQIKNSSQELKKLIKENEKYEMENMTDGYETE